MPCAKCQQHRDQIKSAIKAGSIKRVAVETAAAGRTMNEKLIERLRSRRKSK